MKLVKASLVFAACAAFVNTTSAEEKKPQKCPFSYSSFSSAHFVKGTFQKIRFLIDNFGRYAAFMYVYMYVFPYIESLSDNKNIKDGLKDLFKLYFAIMCSDKIKEHAKVVNSVFEYVTDSLNNAIEEKLSSNKDRQELVEESMQTA